MRGVNSLAKHPERVGTGPKDKKRLQIQLTWQNRPNLYYPVPPLPGAREGRRSLELVEIFQIAMRIFEKRRSVEVDVTRPRRREVRTSNGITGVWGRSLVVWDHSPCVWFFVCGPIETTLSTGLWDQQRRARSRSCRSGWGGPRVRRGEVSTGFWITARVCGFALASK